MASSLSTLLALLSLDNSEYLAGLTSSQAVTDDFTTKLSNTGGAVVVGGLAMAATIITGVGMAAWEAGNKVDEAMDNIIQKTGAPGPVLKILKQDFENVFASVPTDAATASNAIATLNSTLGLSGPALENLAKPLLEVTRMTGGDVTANAKSFAAVIGAWGIPLDQASNYLDKVYVASQKTGAPIEQLLSDVTAYGAPMRAFGMSFDTSAALIATWDSKGVDAGKMVTGLAKASAYFTKEHLPMQKGLADTVSAIQNAGSETDALAIAMKVFGPKGAVYMVDTIRSGKMNIDDLVGSMQNADGQIMKTADKTMEWGEKWKVFQNKMTVALAPLGEKMMTAASGAMDQLVNIFERPDIQATLSKFTDMIGGFILQAVTYIPILIDGFFQFITFLQNNQGIVIGVLAALGVAALAWGVTTAIAAWTAITPLLPVIAVLALIAGAAYLLYQAWQTDWGGIQEKVGAVWAVVQPILQNLWTWLQTNIPRALQALAGFWQNVLWPAMQNVWGWLSGTLFPFLGALADFIGTVLSIDLTILAGIWTNLLWPAIKKYYDFFAANVFPIFRKFDEFLVGNFIKSWSWLTDVIGKVTSALNTMTKSLKGIQLPKALTPGSPTPFEMGLWGIQNALTSLAGTSLPAFNAQLQLSPVGIDAGSMDLQARAASVSTATGSGGSSNNDALLQEVYRMLRDLPNTISRSNRDAFEKARQ